VTSQPNKEGLETRKLEIEIRLLARQEKWELWKSLATVVVPLLAAITLIGGGYKYLKEEDVRQRLKREEVFALGLKNLESKEAYVRLAAVVGILSHVGENKGYDDRVVAVMAYHELQEPDAIVKKTIFGNLRKWRQQDKKMFDDFLSSVRDDLQQVKKDLQAGADKDQKKSLEQEKSVLERIEKLLIQL
jgi:hypothetical protein